jgi:hydrogenase maturation factor
MVVTGDTKIVQKGGAGKTFINTSGIRLVESSLNLSTTNAHWRQGSSLWNDWINAQR